MIVIENNANNPYYNHALETYFLKETNEDVFILWRNRPSVLIGSNQNTLAEINQTFIKDHNIDVVRRLSGGGTVFCDLGNINFTFISSKSSDGSHDFATFAKPVVEALRSLGANATFTGRNDITIDGMKVSGNAQYHYKKRLLHHGTLLYDGNLKDLVGAIKPRPEKLKSKGIQSVRSRVTNIRPHINQPMDVMAFKNYVQKYIQDLYHLDAVYTLNDEEEKAVLKIQKELFETYEWNYGKSPATQLDYCVKHTFGLVEYYIDIKKGLIKSLKIRGDFFGEESIEPLEDLLTECRFEPESIHKLLKDIPLDLYIKGMTVDILVEDLMSI